MSHRSRKAGLALASAAVLMTATATAVAVSPASSTTPSASESTYLVVYKGSSTPADSAAKISAAGGTVVASYSKIGVVVARSASSTFAANVEKSDKVLGAASTAKLGAAVAERNADNGEGSPSAAVAAAWGDSLSGLQWDMTQIDVPEAHGVNDGSTDVVVGDLDTGLDFTHPDLAPNYDASKSADCSSGTAQPLAVGNDANGHGTHTAGTIAAAANGTGVVGVAPGVKIAGVKSSNDDGFFFPEMVVCAYMWVAEQGIDVTNNSYFADPYLFNCVNDPEQRLIWQAERRAINYARSKGTVVVASQGNFSDDLSHPTRDITSPDNTTPIEREIRNQCRVVPTEVPGVVGVTSTGADGLKAYYSSYGISTADVAAPGGDRRFQIPASTGNGRVLSSWPLAAGCAAAQTVFENGAKYCWAQGTSMAGPHVAGLAALILSENPGMSPGAVEALMQQTATPRACPDTTQPIYADFPSVNNGAPQTCTGGTGHNSFYGSGEVNALAALQ